MNNKINLKNMLIIVYIKIRLNYFKIILSKLIKNRNFEKINLLK